MLRAQDIVENLSACLSLTTPPAKLTFLDLPREIRDIIYKLVLISPTPLIAWSGMLLEDLTESEVVVDFREWVCWEGTPQIFDIHGYQINALPVERLAISMALVSRDVSREAAEVFWSNNSFRFIGDNWLWDTVLQWLIGIGPTNRRYLSHLEFQLRRPQHVWQFSDPPGARTQLLERAPGHQWSHAMAMENAREMVYPRNKHLILPKPGSPGGQGLEGVVENISPKLEIVFKMLAQPGKWSKVRLTMLLPSHLVPGKSIPLDAHRRVEISEVWMGMDLPNVMEVCRQKHVTEGGRDLEILWKCKDYGREVQSARESLESLGWELMHFRHDSYSTINMDWKTSFTMKRRPVSGPVEANFPSPHSSGYFS
ncbi:hypothetical protein BDZ45DRAFT_678333 [Acephala macrosclerotiorum]|nr:hypothetical protein BDZ45DRAFT_678333 [Acephala macrosclerotiorum]